eukprot:NODE_12508_length_1221_cov_2.911335.p1 GENE.NODE_12508_length_1221_cov_2.911335~~NODE_12508_length_1221_cov_2.911335.p1  ORF type:complete len:363 (-),score=88.02 NODE_12508_length_1221_cov_2.911335:132-1184(-)
MAAFSLLLTCWPCWRRWRRNHAAPDTAVVLQLSEGAVADIVAAGVLPEAAEAVAALQGAARGDVASAESLADPLTLLRFLNSRAGDLEAAIAMRRDALAWRGAGRIRRLMALHGSGEDYGEDGGRMGDPMAWNWHPHSATPEALLIARHGFFVRLPDVKGEDGAPVAIWRIGQLDVKGIDREGLQGVLQDGMIAHIEDLLQAGRSASLCAGRLVRARVVVDVRGISLQMLSHRHLLQGVLDVVIRRVPEIAASITIVRCPSTIAFLFRIVSPALTEVMRRKIRFSSENFAADLRKHASLEAAVLPVFLGGSGSDSPICRCTRVPVDAWRRTAQTAAPVCLTWSDPSICNG